MQRETVSFKVKLGPGKWLGPDAKAVGELSAALLSLTRQPAGARDRSALAGPAS